MASAMQEKLPELKWVGDLAACIQFYQEVLGLKLLPRPAKLDEFAGYSPSGAWLGDADDKVQFHLIAKDDEWCPGAEAAMSPTGRHTAWMVRDLNAFRARLRKLGIQYNQLDGVVASDQVFVKDPAGFTWEFQEPR